MRKINQAAFDIGQLSERLAEGYYSHSAMLYASTHPQANSLAPPLEAGQAVPVDRIYRKDGSARVYNFKHFLDLPKNNSQIAGAFAGVWIVGAFIQVGDALGRHHYFDRAPELELLRHLRNGVAHGNRFEIRDPLKLASYPAHNKLAWVRDKADFEIAAALHGQPVLFNFMGPGDCLDLLQSVGIYLIRMGNGDPLRP